MFFSDVFLANCCYNRRGSVIDDNGSTNLPRSKDYGKSVLALKHFTSWPLAWITVIGILGMSCQADHVSPRETFDRAEAAYRVGNYDVAHQHYTQFLKKNPDPQLAILAQRRLRSIEREIDNVMGQKTGPRPVYVAGEDPSQAVPTRQPQIFQNHSSLRFPPQTDNK